MKTAMYYNNKDIRIEDQPKPELKQGEVLVKVMASGICGSDVMEWYRIKKAPLVLGHEIAGIVEESKSDLFKKGDRVFATHHVPCDECKACKDGNETVCETLRSTKFYPGGFAEYLKLPEINVQKGAFKLPDSMSFEEGTFIEPLGCVVRAQRKARVKPEHSVLVLGSGISGLLHIQLAKSKGCRVTATDVSQFRLDAAKKFGADEAINAKDYKAQLGEAKRATGAERQCAKEFDRVIVCTGALPAIQQAIKSVAPGGTILFFAPTDPGVNVEMPLQELWSKCATLTSSYAAVHYDLKEAIELIESKKVNVADMVTHRLPLEETQKGFELVLKAEDSIKVIIEPNQ
ncbi:MAG: alcohol dehydrogenase catalytic domain-containing protein [archaeon]